MGQETQYFDIMREQAKKSNKLSVISCNSSAYALSGVKRCIRHRNIMRGDGMGTVIKERAGITKRIPEQVWSTLPPQVRYEVSRLCDGGTQVDEIRLRAKKRASVTSDGKNILLDSVLTQKQMDQTAANICEGSLYAYADSISKGYVTLDGGIRAGLVGRAATERGGIVGVYDISAICFRLPRVLAVPRSPVPRLLREGVGGVLVWSPPGVGKTTLLRGAVRELCSGGAAMRAAVIDSRGELGIGCEGEDVLADILSGYPKAQGIEIATRCMSPELLVCDEIGDAAEVEAPLHAILCGVPLLASAHAGSITELMSRPSVQKLHVAGAFGAYVGIRRGVGGDRIFTVTGREEADRYLQDNRSGAGRH